MIAQKSNATFQFIKSGHLKSILLNVKNENRSINAKQDIERLLNPREFGRTKRPLRKE